MLGCGGWAIINPEMKIFEPFWCGSASCDREICRKKFYLKRVRLLSDLICENSLTRFFTLTLDPKKVKGGLTQCWDEIGYIWSKLRKRLSRAYNELKFVAVLESHPGTKKYKTTHARYIMKGQPHIHGFWNIYIQSRLAKGDTPRGETLKEKWEECGGGERISLNEVVKCGDISEYVSKRLNIGGYVSKGNLLEANNLKGKHKTLWRSKNLKAKFELQKDDSWSILKEDIFIDGEFDLRDTSSYRSLQVWQREIVKERLGSNTQVFI